MSRHNVNCNQQLKIANSEESQVIINQHKTRLCVKWNYSKRQNKSANKANYAEILQLGHLNRTTLYKFSNGVLFSLFCIILSIFLFIFSKDSILQNIISKP